MGSGISLCMIVRDEAENLGRCLRSVRGHVAEMVVVDTGSRDATCAVAESFGARVVRFPWADDFSRARNRSLEEAGGEWILVLDADEELREARLLPNLTAREDVEGWTFTIVSPLGTDGEMGASRHAALRLFRNRAAYRFEGPVHEQIQPGILRSRPDAVIRHAQVEIRHYGYLAPGRPAKTARNIALLQKALAADPFDPFTNYNLGVSYLAAGQPEAARPRFEVARLAADSGSGFAPALYRNYAVCLDELAEYRECLQVLDEGLGHFPAYPDLHFLKGQLFLQLGLLTQARACFLTCSSFRYLSPDYTTMEGVTSFLAQENLATIALREGDPDLAAGYLADVYRVRRSYAVLRRLALVLRQKEPAGLARALAGYVDAGPAEVAGVLFDLGEYEACLAYLENRSGDPRLALVRAGCLSRTGQPGPALALLEAIAAGDADPQRLAREKWLALWLEGQGAPPPGPGEEALVRQAAYGAWRRGDVARALSLAGTVGPSRQVLAEEALARGRPVLAETVLAGETGREAAALKGRVASELGRHREAFAYFLQAARAGSKTCYRRALVAAIQHCRYLVQELLSVEGPNGALQMELFRLASRLGKLVRSGGESEGAGC